MALELIRQTGFLHLPSAIQSGFLSKNDLCQAKKAGLVRLDRSSVRISPIWSAPFVPVNLWILTNQAQKRCRRAGEKFFVRPARRLSHDFAAAWLTMCVIGLTRSENFLAGIAVDSWANKANRTNFADGYVFHETGEIQIEFERNEKYSDSDEARFLSKIQDCHGSEKTSMVVGFRTKESALKWSDWSRERNVPVEVTSLENLTRDQLVRPGVKFVAPVKFDSGKWQDSPVGISEMDRLSERGDDELPDLIAEMLRCEAETKAEAERSAENGA